MLDRFGLLDPATRQRLEQEDIIDRQISQATALHKALRAFDPEIVGVVFVRQESPDVLQSDKGLISVKPGRWHVQRRRPGLPDAFMPIETESGAYREPDFGVLYELQRKDMWHGRNTPEELIAKSEARRKKEKSTPDFSDELASDIRAARRVAGENLDKKAWGKK